MDRGPAARPQHRGRGPLDVRAARPRWPGSTAKGAIAAGRDADFAVLAPEETFTVDPARLHHRNPITAYAGRTLHGVVRATYLRGRLIAQNGAPAVKNPAGRLIERPAGGSSR